MLEGMVLSLLMTSLMCVCKRCGTNIYSFLISYTVIGSYCAVFFCQNKAFYVHGRYLVVFDAHSTYS